MDQQGVVGGDAQLARRRHGLAGELAGEGRDVLLHALGEGRHLLAGGGERIARAMALEELDAETLLELAEAAETVEWLTPSRSAAPPRPRASAMVFTSRKSSQARC